MMSKFLVLVLLQCLCSSKSIAISPDMSGNPEDCITPKSKGGCYGYSASGYTLKNPKYTEYANPVNNYNGYFNKELGKTYDAFYEYYKPLDYTMK